MLKDSVIEDYHMMTKLGIKLQVLLVLSLTVYGCKQTVQGEQGEQCAADTDEAAVGETFVRNGIYSFPGEYEIDHPADLVAYFDSLCGQGAYVMVHGSLQEDSLQVWDAVKLLNQATRQRGIGFPADSLRKAMRSLAQEQTYLYSHGAPEENNGGEAFLFRLIEQAALNCHHVELLTDIYTDDRRAGVLSFSDWSGMNPLYSFLIYRTGHGCHVTMIGEKGDAKIENISHLTDGKGGDYYLCSNNNEGVYFRQYLYGWDGKMMSLLCDP